MGRLGTTRARRARPWLALAAPLVVVGACNLGLSQSQVDAAASSGGGAGPGAGGGGNGGSSTTMVPGQCGDGDCRSDQGEDCRTCPADCGCFQNDGCNAEGKCGRCVPHFSQKLDGVLTAKRGLASIDQKLYVAPTSTAGGKTSAALFEVDACFGTVNSTLFQGSLGTHVSGGPVASPGAGAKFAIAALGFRPSDPDVGAAVVGIGDGPVAAWTTPKNPTPGEDELVDIAATPEVWMAVGTRAASPQTWLAHGSVAGGPICSDFQQLDGAAGAAITSDGKKFYVAANAGSGGVSLASFDAAGCTNADCQCKGHAFTLGTIGSNGTVVTALLAAHGVLYVGGRADDGGGSYAFVASVSPADGTVIFKRKETPSGSGIDAYFALAADANTLYAGGFTGRTDEDDPSVGTPLLRAFTSGSDLAAAPAYDAAPSNATGVVGLAVDPSQPGAFFAQVSNADGVTVARCQARSGGCP